MTHYEHLFLKLIEECAEVQQRVSKLLQFGPEEIQEGQPERNLHRLQTEVNDLLVIIVLLREKGWLPYTTPEEISKAYSDKREKLDKYLELSESLGRVR